MSYHKKLLFLLAFSLLLLSIVTALEVKKSEIVVKTEPYQNLSITIINPSTNESLQTFTGRARKFGEYRATYYGVIDKISISASIINNDTQETFKTEKFGPYNLGVATINLNLTLSNTDEEAPQEVVANITNSSSSITGELELKKSSILGFVFGEGNAKFSNIYYYVGAGALGLIIILIIFKQKIKTDKSPTEPNPNKLKSKSNKLSKTEVKVVDQNIVSVSTIDTEKRISELQKELEQIKSEEKLVKLERQLAQERQELKKLRDEKEFNSQDFNNAKQNSSI